MAQFKISKRQAHIIIVFFDIACIGMLCIFYNELSQLFHDIRNHAKMVTVNSKEGFFIFAIGMPIIHLLIIIEHFYYEFVKRHAHSIGYGFIGMLIFLFISAIAISILIKAKVENAGYINCDDLEWSGTYSVSYTYTLNQEICGQLVAQKAKEK